MYRIRKDNLNSLYAAIAQICDLILPVRQADGITNFAACTENTEADLSATRTAKSPKDAWFPQYETLYTVKREEKKYVIEPEMVCERDFAVLGMRACDAAALRVLDRVFLTDPVDSFYAARRAHGCVIVTACGEPDEMCFCTNFGIDPAESSDADVMTWLTADSLLWEAKTDKGAALTEKLAAAGVLAEDEAAAAEKEAAKDAIENILERLPLKDLPLEGWGAEAADTRFDSPLWGQLYRPCLACGTCTFVCPTCQCYDIKDFKGKQGAERYRCWDSCMYSDFTLMAHGNNRTSQHQRFRQRFMHKLAYFPANNDGMFSCVGCGRCVERCPEGLHIVKVMKAFEKEG